MRCFCGSEMKELFINNDRFSRCPGCGYLCKLSTIGPSEEKARYDKHVCDSGYLDYMNDVYRKIEPLLNPGISIDYGCGKIHALASIMEEHGRACDYYDLYYYRAEIINSIYSNIILIEVFEHMAHPYEALDYLKSLLVSKGSIIIMTKPIKEPLEKWWYLRDKTHVSFVTLKSMEILANMLDLELYFDKENEIFKLSKKN